MPVEGQIRFVQTYVTRRLWPWSKPEPVKDGAMIEQFIDGEWRAPDVIDHMDIHELQARAMRRLDSQPR